MARWIFSCICSRIIATVSPYRARYSLPREGGLREEEVEKGRSIGRRRLREEEVGEEIEEEIEE